MQVDEWVKSGIVQPYSSKFASTVVVTKIKDGTPRVCIDYRRINQVIVNNKYPIPLIEDQIDTLKCSKIFNTLDLRNGFVHVSVDQESCKFTSFVTHEGQYVFLKAPFRLCNLPSVFQRFINYIFRSLVNQGIVLFYFDDIVILAKDVEEALGNLRITLKDASCCFN